MPSMLVHMALAGMIAAALLGAYFDRRSLLVVVGVTALADFDTFLDLFVDFGHRTFGHTLVWPLLAGLLLWIDLRREDSYVREQWGARGIRVASVTILAFATAAVGLDLFTGGVNAFWPLHDQLYAIDGKVELSSQRGVVQTFVDLQSGTEGADSAALGNSSEVHVSTGVVPDEGATERIFPVVRSGWHLLLLVTGTFVTGARFFVENGESE
jgi:hypothetical protein